LELKEWLWVVKYMPLLEASARKFAREFPSLGDAAYDAVLDGLIRAARKFDRSRGVAFGYFAKQAIRWSLLRLRVAACNVRYRQCSNDDVDFFDRLVDEGAFDPASYGRVEELKLALLKLPMEDRQLLWLRYWAGMTYKEIGGSLKVTMQTVINREKRLLEQLQDMLS